MYLFDAGYVIPYIQNFNMEIQRELTKDLSLDVRYVGTKGTRLYAGVSLNEVNIFDSGIFDAFNLTRIGGNAALFDKMLMGLNVPNFGVVNGSTLTGSAALRQNTTTRSFIANGNVGALANYLNTNPFASGVPGGRVAKWGLAGELDCHQSAIPECGNVHQSGKLNVPFFGNTVDETVLSRIHESGVVHMEPELG